MLQALWIWSRLREREERLAHGDENAIGPYRFDSLGHRIDPLATSMHGYWSDSRVGRLSAALSRSSQLAYGMLEQRLSGIEISTIWGVLYRACEDIALYFGGSVLLGGLIGGVVGAFGGGIGAIPGATLGAAGGAELGSLILGFLGLKSLVEGLSEALPSAVECYRQGFVEAWGPEHHDPNGPPGFGGQVTFAARDIARGHVIIIQALLMALVAYLSRGRGGRSLILREVRESAKLGPRVADWLVKNEQRLRDHPMLKPGRESAKPQPVKSEGTGRGSDRAMRPPPQTPSQILKERTSMLRGEREKRPQTRSSRADRKDAEGSGNQSAMRGGLSGPDNARLQQLITEGHGVQRHGAQITRGQLIDRAMYGKDPITGTTVDGVHGGVHQYAQHATKVTSDPAYVHAENYARNTQQFIDATTSSTTGRAQVEIPLKDIFGDNFSGDVFGITRQGPKTAPTGYTETVFGPDSSMIVRYKQNSAGDWVFNTMFPQPK